MTLTYRGGVVKVEMAFLDRLAVVALRIGQAEKALFQEVTVSSATALWSADAHILLLVPKGEGDVLQAM